MKGRFKKSLSKKARKGFRGLPAATVAFKCHERHGACRAQQEGTNAFDFGFLWERLGLEREE